MNISREQAIERACKIVAIAYHSVGDYSEPSDGFCRSCQHFRFQFGEIAPHYLNTSKALDYVYQAVIEKLQRDGHKITQDVVYEPIL